jgi:acyl-CoA synthetase (AMP-forming)/AMP-acid ligase II
VAFTFLADGEVEAGSLTYGELERQAGRCAAQLRREFEPGDRALLLYPQGLEFIPAFLGCLWAGVIAVPVHAPRPNDRSASRLRAIVHDAGVRAVLTTRAFLGAGPRGSREAVPDRAEVLWWATDGAFATDGEAGPPDFPLPAPGDVAFLQYTSGSTSEPKGVLVTHGNLVHNERMIGAAFAQDEGSLVVGWLPLFHDMGLIGQLLQPLWAGARCVLMAPAAFLQKPSRWLAAISRYRATTSGGPNFAYELCAAKVPLEALPGLDLASWRVAFNGAEPVRAATLERFAERFRACGFRPEAFHPC